MEKRCKARKKAEMLLLKQRLHKTFQTLKSFIFGRYQKLHKIPIFNLLSQKNHNHHKKHELDEFFKGFSEHWKSNLEQSHNHGKPEVSATTPQEVQNVENELQNSQNYKLKTEEKMDRKQRQEAKKDEIFVDNGNGNGNGSSQNNKLACKMKEFEMLQVDDVDDVQDVKEVLDCYSRLKSPIYVEMVDEFFMDMYSEFSIQNPKPSVSCNSSMRMIGSCNSSMRRLGPLKL